MRPTEGYRLDDAPRSMLEQFAVLREEVRLQTQTSLTQYQQNAQSLSALEHALEQFATRFDDLRQGVQETLGQASSLLHAGPTIDVTPVTEQLATLRQEIHLQTQASLTRYQENAHALASLSRSLEQFEGRFENLRQGVQGSLVQLQMPAASVDLTPVVEQFGVLRHEIVARSDAQRAQNEQHGRILEQLASDLAKVEADRTARHDAGQQTAERFSGLVNDLGQWIHDNSVEAEAILATPPPTTVDLATLVGQFTALRQEVNLQTRSARTQGEQNVQTLAELTKALATVESLQEQLQARTDDAEQLRPLLKAMIDAHDALALAQRQVRKMQASLAFGELELPPLPPTSSNTDDIAPPPEVEFHLTGLARWLGVEAKAQTAIAPLKQWAHAQHQRLKQPSSLDDYRRGLAAWAERNQEKIVQYQEASIRWRQTIESILAGYAMSLQRLERTLEKLGLERVECVGQPFDPELMEVAEVVKDPGRTVSEVLEAIRPGYRWRGKIFRLAHVRVARG